MVDGGATGPTFADTFTVFVSCKVLYTVAVLPYPGGADCVTVWSTPGAVKVTVTVFPGKAAAV